ncbi:hypothetical protein [Microbacterium esteraromaticum]|uniref:hypothetical protein n=1 Tax=Microbacterium esteraromaticum TaxID=57043 RepID=UPI001C95A94C|nr:hypothetical protein [Microbacterium esteraromaticum]MBY6061033.1 hypothetical protein [Microbacterium esteraromaticum]
MGDRSTSDEHYVLDPCDEVLGYEKASAVHVRLAPRRSVANASARHQTLWGKGFLRDAAAFDCLPAAYAVANDAMILNFDRDFGYIELATEGRVRQEYVVA